MALPLMPKATAVWLIDNTGLTFEQIAAFCGLHTLEVQGIADGDVAPGMQGLDPMMGGQLTCQEIERCEGDPTARLHLAESDIPQPVVRSKGPRYTPVAKRGDKPDAIAWLLRNHPGLSDPQICKLIGTTKPTVNAVRSRTHWNSPNIRQQHPITLGLCSTAELNEALEKARERNPEPVAPQYEGPDGREQETNSPADRFAIFTGGLTGTGGGPRGTS